MGVISKENCRQSPIVSTFWMSILVSIVIIFTIVGLAIGIHYTKNSTRDEPIFPLSVEIPEATNKNVPIDLAQIEQLITVVSYDKGYDNMHVNKVGIRKTKRSNDLFISDENLSPNSLKILYSIPAPGVTEFTSIKEVSDYIVAIYSGGDASDMVIATKKGDVITTSVWDLNEAYRGWVFSDVNWVTKNIASLDLFQVDGSKAYLEIDLLTGKVIEGSFKKIKR